MNVLLLAAALAGSFLAGTLWAPGAPRVEVHSALEAREEETPRFVELLYEKEAAFRRRVELDVEDEAREEEHRAILEGGHRSGVWRQFLDSSTAARESGVNCSDPRVLRLRAPYSGAAEVLRECGFVQLLRFHEPAALVRWRSAFERWKREEEEEARLFKYPCQGRGRYEYMVPWREPFNSSAVWRDTRLHGILFELFQRFKLELQTVITSKPGAGYQRFHQGWPYLWSPDERVPPFAVVVGTPLVTVTKAMGPTQVCVGMKKRFYQGYRCPEPLSFPSQLGDVIVFDYWLNHRGPANGASIERPMISAVYSKLWFMNTQALVNRAVPLIQTLHQRRYMEAFFRHPKRKAEMFKV